MGLDMYLYRARKLRQSEIQKINGSDTEDIHYTVFSPDENDEEEMAMLHDIMPYLTKIDIKRKYWNIEKLAKEAGLDPNGTSICGQCYGQKEIELTLCRGQYPKTTYKDVSFPKEQAGDYTVIRDETGYAVDLTEVAYWRKQYDLQDEIYELYDGNIMNCGYHSINKDMLKAIKKTGAAKGVRLSKDLFYHEWY